MTWILNALIWVAQHQQRLDLIVAGIAVLIDAFHTLKPKVVQSGAVTKEQAAALDAELQRLGVGARTTVEDLDAILARLQARKGQAPPAP